MLFRSHPPSVGARYDVVKITQGVADPGAQTRRLQIFFRRLTLTFFVTFHSLGDSAQIVRTHLVPRSLHIIYAYLNTIETTDSLAEYIASGGGPQSHTPLSTGAKFKVKPLGNFDLKLIEKKLLFIFK